MKLNKRLGLLLGLSALSLTLVACDSDKDIETLAEEGKFKIEVEEGQFKTLGYLAYNDDWNDTPERVGVLEDTTTGCQYLFSTSSSSPPTPYYDSNGFPKGCKNVGSVSKDTKESTKEDYLSLLREYYPDKDDKELLYILESFLNYKNKSLSEIRSVLENLSLENSDISFLDDSKDDSKKDSSDESKEESKEKSNDDESSDDKNNKE